MTDIKTLFAISLLNALAILVLLMGTAVLSWILYDMIREWGRKRKAEQHEQNKN